MLMPMGLFCSFLHTLPLFFEESSISQYHKDYDDDIKLIQCIYIYTEQNTEKNEAESNIPREMASRISA
mgnify:CR=1 FL=1